MCEEEKQQTEELLLFNNMLRRWMMKETIIVPVTFSLNANAQGRWTVWNEEWAIEIK